MHYFQSVKLMLSNFLTIDLNINSSSFIFIKPLNLIESYAIKTSSPFIINYFNMFCW
jgi:hypothetical protein